MNQAHQKVQHRNSQYPALYRLPRKTTAIADTFSPQYDPFRLYRK